MNLTSDQNIFVRALKKIGIQLIDRDFENYRKSPIASDELKDMIHNEVINRKKTSGYYSNRLDSYGSQIEELLDLAIPQGEYPKKWLDELNIVFSNDGIAHFISTEKLSEDSWVVRIDFDCAPYGVVSELLIKDGRVVVFESEQNALETAKRFIEQTNS